MGFFALGRLIFVSVLVGAWATRLTVLWIAWSCSGACLAAIACRVCLELWWAWSLSLDEWSGRLVGLMATKHVDILLD